MLSKQTCIFLTFFTTCQTPSIKILYVLAIRPAENLTRVVFRQPFVIQYVRTHD